MIYTGPSETYSEDKTFPSNPSVNTGLYEGESKSTKTNGQKKNPNK